MSKFVSTAWYERDVEASEPFDEAVEADIAKATGEREGKGSPRYAGPLTETERTALVAALRASQHSGSWFWRHYSGRANNEAPELIADEVSAARSGSARLARVAHGPAGIPPVVMIGIGLRGG